MIYCEMVSDKILFDEIQGSKQVCIIGCPGCANSSLYIKGNDNLPMLKFSMFGFKPVSMSKKIDSISKQLNLGGLEVKSWVGKFPGVSLCMLSHKARKKLMKKYHNFDTFIVIACESGKKSIESVFPERTIVGAMKTIGMVNAIPKQSLFQVSLHKHTICIERIFCK